MSKALTELQEIFSVSEITPEDQNELLVFLPILPESVLKQLAKVFKTNPDLIKDLNDNFKAKFNALTGQGDKTWDQIIAAEEKEINDLKRDEISLEQAGQEEAEN